MVPDRQDNPHVPLSVKEIADCAVACADAGAAMIHLHVRDDDGRATLCPNRYTRVIAAIRERRPGLVLCVSLSGRGGVPEADRHGPLSLAGDVKPDMASLTLSSLNFPRCASPNPPELIQGLARHMLDRGIAPELEAFDLGMVNYAKYLIGKGLLEPPYRFNLLLGNIAGAQLDPLHLGAMLAALPPDSMWLAAGMGLRQLAANALGIMFGDGIRVGIEDNPTEGLSNEELVRRAVGLAALFGRKPATAVAARQKLGLPAR